MEKITLDKINIGNIVVARNGWTGYITEIEEVDNSFVSNLTKKTVEITAKVLIGVRTDGEKEGFIFRCPVYMVGRTFSQIGIYKINDNSEIISAAKTIEKLSKDCIAFQADMGNEKDFKDGRMKAYIDGAYRNLVLGEDILNKINELVDAVNKLNGVYNNEC
jgi:hypothetical protein